MSNNRVFFLFFTRIILAVQTEILLIEINLRIRPYINHVKHFNYHNLWGHSLKLKPVGSLSVYSCRYNFFSRNELYKCGTHSNVIEATSLDAFKTRLSKIVFVKCIISSREYISAIIYLSVLFLYL